MRNFLYFFVFCICFMMLVSCSSDNRDTTPLNNKQLEDFIKSHQLNVTANQEIGNKFTVIMFENAKSKGYYMAYVKDGEIGFNSARAENNTDTTSVSTGGVATDFPFVTISINDEELIEKAYMIKIIWDDGHESIEKVNNRTSLIIPYDYTSFNVTKRLEQVYLLDENGKAIFEEI